MLSTRFNQIKVEHLKGEFAGFDFGKIQDVIDDRQQSVRTGANGFGKLALLRVEVAVEQQTGHADDAVHRRADLVAHIGQELALGRYWPLRRPAWHDATPAPPAFAR